MNLENEITITVTSENVNFVYSAQKLIETALMQGFFIVDKDQSPKAVMRSVIVPLTQHNFLELRNNNYLPAMDSDRTDRE